MDLLSRFKSLRWIVVVMLVGCSPAEPTGVLTGGADEPAKSGQTAGSGPAGTDTGKTPPSLASLLPGHWYEIPDSRLDQSGVFPPSPVPPGNPPSVMGAWSGGTIDTKRDRLLIHGGGHGDYAGNEIYAFDLHTLKWTRIWGPSPNRAIPMTAADESNQAYHDGNPESVHTYGGFVYLPDLDKVWRGGGAHWIAGGGSPASWMFDMATSAWTRLPNQKTLGTGEVAAYDPVDKVVYGSSDKYVVHRYDPATNSYTAQFSGVLGAGEEPMAALDVKRRLFVVVGNGKAHVAELATKRVRKLTTSGPQNVVAARGPGFEWDSSIQKFVGWAGGTSVYVLDPATWTWTERPAASSNTVTPTMATRLLQFGKFRYVPSMNLYVSVGGTGQSVFAYRLAAP